MRGARGASPDETRVDLVAVLRPRRGAGRWSTTCGGSADAVRDRPHRLAARRARPPDRRPGRRLARAGRHHAGRAAGRLAQRGAGPVPDGDHQQRARVADDEADHDPARRRPTCPSAAPTSTSPIAVAVLAADGQVPARRAGRHRVHRRAHARPAACGRCPGCCRWCWPPPSAASAGSSSPSPRHGRRRWCPGMRSSGCARSARWSPSSAASEVPGGAAGRADVRQHGCSPGAARSGSRSSTCPTCSAWPTPGTPSRSPRPAATTCCCPGPKGAGQDQHRRADPDDPARPDPRGVARADRHPLPGRRARPGRRDARRRPPYSGPAPRREQGQPDRRRQRAGPAGRDQPRALRRAVPRRVPAVPRRRDRGAAPAAGERRRHDRPARGVGDAAGAGHGRCSPATRARAASYHRLAGDQPVPLHATPRCATTSARSPARSPTGSTSPVRSTPLTPADARPVRRSRSRRRRSATGSPRPGERQASRYADESWRLNGQAPGAGAARALAAAAERRSASSTTPVYAAG